MLLVAVAGGGLTVGNANEGSLAYFGAWVGEQVNIPGDLDAFEQAVGKKMAIVHRFSGNPPYLNGEHFDAAWAEEVRDRGAIPMLSWEPRLGENNGLGEAAVGSRDEYIRLWARELRDWGHPIFFRMMWEQNAAWFPWRATGEPNITQFKALWQRIVGIFREEGAYNVTFVWSPHVSGFGASPIMDTYPGDGCVDWVALDGYPYRSGRGDFFQTFKPDYDILVSQVDKPIMIAETSLENGSDQAKADIIADILGNQLPNNFPKVKALVWFDEVDCNGINYSVLTAQGPLSRAAFRQGLASPYYVSNRFGGLVAAPIPVPEIAIILPTATPTDTPTPSPTPTMTPTATSMPTSTGTAATTTTLAPTATMVASPIPTATLAPVPDLPENLLANPGFEQPAGGVLPANWTVTSYSAPVSLSGLVSRTGSRSLQHSSAQGPSYIVYQDVPVTRGGSYSFLGWVWIKTKDGYFDFNLQLLAMNIHGGVIRAVNLANFKSTTAGWEEVRVQDILVSPETVNVRLAMKVDNLKATFYVDDFILVPAEVPLPAATGTPTPEPTATIEPTPTLTPTLPPPPPATPTVTQTPCPTTGPALNLLNNPSFDLSVPGTRYPIGWDWSFWAGQQLWVDPQAARNGVGQGLTLTGENLSCLVYQQLPVEAQGRYLFTGWVNVPDKRGGAFKAEAVPMNQFSGTVGPPFSKGYFLPTDGWQEFGIELFIPPGATQVRIQLKLEGFRGRVNLDDLAFFSIGRPATATVAPVSSPTPQAATQTATFTPTTSPTATWTATLAPTATATATATLPSAGNLLANPSFRSLANGTELPENWTVPPWMIGKVSVQNAAAYDNDGSGLQLWSDGSSYQVFQEAPVQPGRRYRCEGWLRLPDISNGVFRIEIVPLNQYGGVVGIAVGQSYSRIDTRWQNFRLEAAAPTNAAAIRVQIKAEHMIGRAQVDALVLRPFD